jgi:hypothetical protein
MTNSALARYYKAKFCSGGTPSASAAGLGSKNETTKEIIPDCLSDESWILAEFAHCKVCGNDLLRAASSICRIPGIANLLQVYSANCLELLKLIGFCLTYAELLQYQDEPHQTQKVTTQIVSHISTFLSGRQYPQHQDTHTPTYTGAHTASLRASCRHTRACAHTCLLAHRHAC